MQSLEEIAYQLSHFINFLNFLSFLFLLNCQIKIRREGEATSNGCFSIQSSPKIKFDRAEIRQKIGVENDSPKF